MLLKSLFREPFIIFFSSLVFVIRKKFKRIIALGQRNVGAYSDGVPPLPIPNRVVKPISADGTEVDASGE